MKHRLNLLKLRKERDLIERQEIGGKKREP